MYFCELCRRVPLSLGKPFAKGNHFQSGCDPSRFDLACHAMEQLAVFSGLARPRIFYALDCLVLEPAK